MARTLIRVLGIAVMLAVRFAIVIAGVGVDRVIRGHVQAQEPGSRLPRERGEQQYDRSEHAQRGEHVMEHFTREALESNQDFVPPPNSDVVPHPRIDILGRFELSPRGRLPHHHSAPPPTARSPEWPLEVARLQTRLRDSGGAAREASRAALWSLLVEALAGVLRGYARRAGATDTDALEDIACEKALEMHARSESGAWDATGRSAGEIVRYVAHAACNGWLDHQVRTRREVRVEQEAEFDVETVDGSTEFAPVAAESGPEGSVIARELASALRGCLEMLPGRERRVWFFRAYYEMSSRDIASHPDVDLRLGHVDVVNQRARDALRACTLGKGHDLVELPPEAFVELWEVLERLAPRIDPTNAPEAMTRRSP